MISTTNPRFRSIAGAQRNPSIVKFYQRLLAGYCGYTQIVMRQLAKTYLLCIFFLSGGCIPSHAILLEQDVFHFENSAIAFTTTDIVLNPPYFVGFCGTVHNLTKDTIALSVDSVRLSIPFLSILRFDLDTLISARKDIEIELLKNRHFVSYPGDESHIRSQFLASRSILPLDSIPFEVYFPMPQSSLSWTSDTLIFLGINCSLAVAGQELQSFPEIRLKRLIHPPIKLPRYKFP